MEHFDDKIDYRSILGQIEQTGIKSDLMCIGAHPDDVEIGMGGSLAYWSEMKLKIIVVDLTKGDKGNNGTPEKRVEEANEAGHIMGVSKRYILDYPDRRIEMTDSILNELSKLIRIHRPNAIFFPYENDKHPDHQITSKIVKEAVYDANLSKIQPELPPWKCSELYQYFINDIGVYDRYVDITGYVEIKEKALYAHKSQFVMSDESVQTTLNHGFIETLKIRDAYFGSQCGVGAAECFISGKPSLLTMKQKE